MMGIKADRPGRLTFGFLCGGGAGRVRPVPPSRRGLNFSRRPPEVHLFSFVPR